MRKPAYPRLSNKTELHPPGPTQSVYREDCTQCFDSIDEDYGLNVCLYCFNGGCVSPSRDHALLHYETVKHPLALNIKRKRKHKQTSRDEPPHKISKLAIAAETETDRYDVITRVECYECQVEDVERSGKLAQVVDGVMKANTFAKQEEVKAWEQEMTACEHTLCLEQQSPRSPLKSLGHCAQCDLDANLWLCLSCGNLGCGRAQYGGVGGNSHALAHTDQAGHPVAVKLGSLTADGTADIYCYSCNEERIDPALAEHLAHWGINIADRQKTEKSLTELQIEQNLKWEFSMTTDDGQELKPLFGPGLIGLKNLGNSCYLASVLQCLFSFPEFKARYLHANDTPPAAQHPAEDLETQLQKMADGLLSGRYSKPDTDILASEHSAELPHQRGLAPAMLKHLIGRGHAEFSTMRQQDAFEFLLHLLQLISRASQTSATNPVDAFKFVMEQRLQCLQCRRVRYKSDEMENISIPVPIRRVKNGDVSMTNDDSTKDTKKQEFEPVTFKECLDIFTAEEKVELRCPACDSNDGFIKQSLFKTFPTILAVNMRRFEIVNWLPTKQDVPVIVQDDSISLDSYRSTGKQSDEELLPEDTVLSARTGFVANEAALSQLEAMGFLRVPCEKALKATGNSDAEAASNWLFEHMEDSDIDEPMGQFKEAATSKIDTAQIEELGNMGFNAPQARQALKETGGDMERAVDWLFSHPDAQGDYETDEVSWSAMTLTFFILNSSQQTAVPEEDRTTKTLPGTDTASAGFRLQSIVCHKGSSIHAGYVEMHSARICC